MFQSNCMPPAERAIHRRSGAFRQLPDTKMLSAKRLWEVVKQAGVNWSLDEASSLGAALAFYCAFSLAPLLVIVVTIVGHIVGAQRAYGYVASELTALLGSGSAQLLLSAMRSSQTQQGTIATIVSIVSLVVGATSVFTVLEVALEQMWGIETRTSRGWWGFVRTRLMSLGVILSDRVLAAGIAVDHYGSERAACVYRPPIHRLSRPNRDVQHTAVNRHEYRFGGVDLSVHADTKDGVGADIGGSPGDGVALSCRALGDRPVSWKGSTAFCIRRGGILRRASTVALLLRADIPLWGRVHCLFR